MKSLTIQFRSTLLASCFLGSGAWLDVKADYSATVVSQGPVGYWRLNETNPPTAPQPAANLGSLGAGGNGDYLLNPTLGEPGAFPGNPATSVKFSNPKRDAGYGGSKVEIPYNLALNPSGPFTVEFWAKPSTIVTDVFCMVASLDSDPAIAVGPDNNPRAGWLFYQGTNATGNVWQFRIGNANNYLDKDSIKGGTVTAGAWHLIAGVYDGSTATLYVNGARVASGSVTGYQANRARPFRIGTTDFTGVLGTFAGNRGFDGWLEEVAFYGTALAQADIAAHYGAATTNAAGYAAMVLAKKPIGYWRLGEPGNPPAQNLGSLGLSANGHYLYPVNPGQAGPQPTNFPGFEADNRACGFAGTNGYVALPPLGLNTNTVTFTAWIRAAAIETNNAGIIFCRAGTTVAGLKFDINDPNGLSYNWNDDDATFNFKSSLPVPVGKWAFVALIVQPDQAILCLQDGTSFASATNYTTHPEQAFDGNTLIGTDSQNPNLTFNGLIDEVAIFNRALSVGEVYSEYGAAVSGIKPTLFTDVQVSPDQPYVGDALTLSVDVGGTPSLNYQWRKNGSPIPGAASNTLLKRNAGAADSGTYDVVITNPFGSVTSRAAAVTVQPIVQPVISQDPQSRSLYAGGSLSLTVQASGGGLSYQWLQGGANVPGATNASYSIASVSATNAGAYQVRVSNQLGSALSAVATVTILAPAPGTYEATILGDGPEAWWRLNDAPGTGILADALGRHDGTYIGGVTPGVPGIFPGSTNGAANFDGTSGYGEVPFSKALNTSNFTIECWVKAKPVAFAMSAVASFTQPPGRGYILQKSQEGVWFELFGNGADRVMYVVPGSDAIYGKWTHLAATYNGSRLRGYVNGRLDVAADATIVPNNIAPLRIGYDQHNNSWNNYWEGDLDEVVYYQKALPSAEIAAHYAAALYGTNSLPVFTQQPESQNVIVGFNFFLTSLVDGSLPISLQWSKNGAPIAGATNDTLVLTNLTYKDTGVYRLNATNLVGGTSSAPATITVVPPPQFANVTNGLVLHLKFDGDYKDSSGHRNNAQPVGAPKFVTGVIGSGALHYSTLVDASNPNRPIVTSTNFVTLGTRPDLQFSSNVSFSVSFWVRQTGTSSDLPFFCNSLNSYSDPGYTLAPSYGRGGWSWSLGDVTTSGYVGIYGPDGSLNDGSWHHLAFTFDRAGSALTYVDGFAVDSRSIVPIGELDTGQPTTIGQTPAGNYPGNANPFGGQADIDDVGVWRRVLDPFEVYSIFAAGQNGVSFDTFGPVSLTLSRVGGIIQLVWPAGTLMQADEVVGPWSPVAGATPPYFSVTPTAARKFYRVQGGGTPSPSPAAN